MTSCHNYVFITYACLIFFQLPTYTISFCHHSPRFSYFWLALSGTTTASLPTLLKMISENISESLATPNPCLPTKRPFSHFDNDETPDDGADLVKRPRGYEFPDIPPLASVPTEMVQHSVDDVHQFGHLMFASPWNNTSREQSADSSKASFPLLSWPDPLRIAENGTSPTLVDPPQQPERSSETSQQDKRRALEVDTCFGVVSTTSYYMYLKTAMSDGQQVDINECEIRLTSVKKSKSPQEIELIMHTNSVMMRDPETRNFAGFLPPLAADIINPLFHRYQATFSAVVKDACGLAVTVYGTQDNGAAIGNFLSKNQWFLQTPDQYDTSMPYINPQVLLRPGMTFERWHTPKETMTFGQSSQGLKTISKSKINEILDSCAALAPSIFSEVCATDRLTTDLKP